jgi:hypothetical protein
MKSSHSAVYLHDGMNVGTDRDIRRNYEIREENEMNRFSEN